MAHWNQVCELRDMLAERGVAWLIDDLQIAIFRVEGDRVMAVGNLDPFSNLNVISRGIVGTKQGGGFVASPMYKQRCDLVTGAAPDDMSVRLPVFLTRVEDGLVYVALSTA